LTINWQVKQQLIQNNTVMKSPNNKTQQHRLRVKNLSALLAIGLAFITLFQAGIVKSENSERAMSTIESELILEVDEWFAAEEMELEQTLLEEAVEETDTSKVFDTAGNLVMEGDPSQNEALRQLVNSAEYLSEFSGDQYYTLTK